MESQIKISPKKIVGSLNLLICLISFIGIMIIPYNSSLGIQFTVLLMVFSIPALIYIIACLKSVIRGGFKYFIYSEKTSELTSTEETIQNSEQLKSNDNTSKKIQSETTLKKKTVSSKNLENLIIPLVIFLLISYIISFFLNSLSISAATTIIIILLIAIYLEISKKNNSL